MGAASLPIAVGIRGLGIRIYVSELTLITLRYALPRVVLAAPLDPQTTKRQALLI